MKHVAALVMVLGCGGAKPAEPLETPARRAVPPEPQYVLQGVRPEIEVTLDLQSYGRWPLTIAEHPELEPHFDVADALAQPGVSWLDLCSRGIASRHMTQHAELGEYLTAWCHVAKQEYREALVGLGPLLKFEKLRPAIELDASAILAGGIQGRDAEGALRHADLLDVHVVDLASASYFEAGRLDDARELNHLAQDMDHTPTDTAECARMVRAIADSSALGQAQAQYLEHVGHSERCSHETAIVAGIPSADFMRVYALWPTNRALGYDEWMREAIRDGRLSDHEGDRLEEAALELALRTSRCYSERLEVLYGRTKKLRDHYVESVSGPRALRTPCGWTRYSRRSRSRDRRSTARAASERRWRFRCPSARSTSRAPSCGGATTSGHCAASARPQRSLATGHCAAFLTPDRAR